MNTTYAAVDPAMHDLPSYDQATRSDFAESLDRETAAKHSWIECRGDQKSISQATNDGDEQAQREYWNNNTNDWLREKAERGRSRVVDRLTKAIVHWNVRNEQKDRWRELLSNVFDAYLGGWKVQAVHAFEAEDPSDMSFPSGQIINVTSVSPTKTWLRGTFIDAEGTQQYGIFPCTTCQYRVEAMYDFGGTKGWSSASFVDGQIINIIGVNYAWWHTSRTVYYLRGEYTDSEGNVEIASIPRNAIAQHHPEIPAKPINHSKAQPKSKVPEVDTEVEWHLTKTSILDQMESLKMRLERSRKRWRARQEELILAKEHLSNDCTRSILGGTSEKYVANALNHMHHSVALPGQSDIPKITRRLDSFADWLERERQNFCGMEAFLEADKVQYKRSYHSVRFLRARLDLLGELLEHDHQEFLALD